MAKEETTGSEFTPEKIKLYEEYLETGKINGKEVNHYAVARELGTSIARINKWHQEQSKTNVQEKESAIHELEVLQKKSQSLLIEKIVKVALVIISGVGVTVTALYVFAMVGKYDTKIIESTWSNAITMLLSSCFSIIGTIMGVKYANSKKED